LGMGVAVLDRELRVTAWNDHAKKLWGVDLGDVRDQHFLNLDIGLPVQELRDALRACLAGGAAGGERRMRARDRAGRDITCRVLCTPLRTPRGEVNGAVVLMEPASAKSAS